jgi:hypothetical protein
MTSRLQQQLGGGYHAKVEDLAIYDFELTKNERDAVTTLL